MGKKIDLIVIMLLLLVAFTGCKDNEDENTYKSAIGDVFIDATLINDSTVNYALNYRAYSNVEADTVFVKREGDDQESALIGLSPLEYNFTFVYRPSYESASSELPDEGEFIFEVHYPDGEMKETMDILDTAFIDPPVFQTIEFDDEDHKVIINWERDSKADGYKVSLVDSAGVICYESSIFSSDNSKVSISKYTYGWYENHLPEAGQEFVIVLQAFLYEKYKSVYDLQCRSVNNIENFIWESVSEE